MLESKLTSLSLQSIKDIGLFISSTKSGSDCYRNDVLAALAVAGGDDVFSVEMLLELVIGQGDKLIIAGEIMKRARQYGYRDVAEIAEAIIKSLKMVVTHKGRLSYSAGARIMDCSDKTYKNKYAGFINAHVDDITIKMAKVIHCVYEYLE